MTATTRPCLQTAADNFGGLGPPCQSSPNQRRRRNDKLFGGLDNDPINGGSGNDILFGSYGFDLMSGDAGAGKFVVRQGNFDRIMDFNPAQEDLWAVHSSWRRWRNSTPALPWT